MHFEKESNLINHWIISSFRLNAMAKSSDDFEMTPKRQFDEIPYH